jgi:RNA polymerase sigma-70 factor (ECF subfamily)
MSGSGDNRIRATPALSAEFTTTHWSVVLAAADRRCPQAFEALEQLCRTYWYPLYAFVLRQGRAPHDAQDLTQGFFAYILGKDFLEGVRPEKGRFRSFLLASLKHFLADEWDKGQAAGRGGGQVLLPLDDQEAETRYRLEPADPLDPKKFYEQRWALTLLDRVLDRLQAEHTAAGKQAVFQQLQPFLLGEKAGATYAEMAVRLGSTEGAITMMVHRMRPRYRELFREEIAHTVASPNEIDEETRHLFRLLAR